MQENQNTKTVQDIYAAFGKGDIASVLAAMDEQIVWKPVMGAASYVPTAGERRGKAAVGEFFRILGDTVAFQEFQPQEFIAQGDTVVALGRYTGASKAGGPQFSGQWAMVFGFRNGKIVEFREYADTASLNAAFQGAAARV
jgi:ketosteroid isomerase-like protein